MSGPRVGDIIETADGVAEVKDTENGTLILYPFTPGMGLSCHHDEVQRVWREVAR